MVTTTTQPVRKLTQKKSPALSHKETVKFFSEPERDTAEKEKFAEICLERFIDTITLEEKEFPQNLEDLGAWLNNKNIQACESFQSYLERRRQNGAREYFKNVGEALEFLVKIGPTKMVDGSWLYSLCKYWQNPVYNEAISIYLDELGGGSSSLNHVCLYQQLLDQLELNDFENLLSDEHYIQAAVQLALAYAPAEYIPEVLGFNMGYEQLPLHLLISNYELKELGIDSHYFNLHITIDNFDNGHAQKALEGVLKVAQRYQDKEEFLRRVKIGYYLNDVGIGSTAVVKNLDLRSNVEKILIKKAKVGRFIHGDKCRIENRQINDWLQDDESTVAFLDALIRKNWIKPGEDVQESRFWKLIDDDRGKMFGVFSYPEKQMIYDWIQGPQSTSTTSLRGWARKHEQKNQSQDRPEDMVDFELTFLKKSYQAETDFQKRMNMLLPYLAPHMHHTPVGLWSTDQFTRSLFPALKASFV
ncbi:iron-containing redox enzyme family protein [Acinetobacter radioresistens]|mgnify:CR=1 FL=1|uniref:Iron-containing redox enzyme family protein n=1 Tax=Acinetobacter radioresistens TaxID=40216 RepID=A0A8H2K4L3_ACIRA|nr:MULTISPECIES: iron-containing redox enzyme family protein [Acinetobacter]EEY85846.1 hypothetical protein HMPREF0018_02426 [Acinetobacter radioresistens SH164]ENV85579.1 hypothetical protein F940_01800 [Acinetobacter radioresistens NIPH 2130]EXB73457.1 hypothetical protein J550_0718 [Acinetobacter sp. 230853]EXB80621.1 hypothetical protein J538_2941 [Acinetobacter sp. 272263]EXC33917.1 hypothetical protein J520_0626 [Acinetobacter sp. 869535]